MRFPKGAVPADIPALERVGRDSTCCAAPATTDVLVVAVGAMRRARPRRRRRGWPTRASACTVVDPRWVKPVTPRSLDLARRHRLVVTIEDGVRVGGVGSTLAQAMRDAGDRHPVQTTGSRWRSSSTASGPRCSARCGLTAQDIARDVAEGYSALPANAGAPRTINLSEL